MEIFLTRFALLAGGLALLETKRTHFTLVVMDQRLEHCSRHLKRDPAGGSTGWRSEGCRESAVKGRNWFCEPDLLSRFHHFRDRLVAGQSQVAKPAHVFDSTGFFVQATFERRFGFLEHGFRVCFCVHEAPIRKNFGAQRTIASWRPIRDHKRFYDSR